MWLIGAMVCLLAAPWVQLSVSAGNGWPHNALRHHRLMPISCHFRDCKALLITSPTHVSGAIVSVHTYTKVKVTRGRRQIRRPGGGIILDPFGSTTWVEYFSSQSTLHLMVSRYTAHRMVKYSMWQKGKRQPYCSNFVKLRSISISQLVVTFKA